MSEQTKTSGGWRTNKWVRAAIPAFLLHCSTGTVYCWSIFSQEIADYIGFSKGATEWAFSFAIFFLAESQRVVYLGLNLLVVGCYHVLETARVFDRVHEVAN